MKYHSSALRRVLRYHLQAAPLLLPLLSVVGALCGGYYYLLTIISIIVAHSVGLLRVVFCSVLCAAVAAIHYCAIKIDHDEFVGKLENEHALSIRGTVERSMSNGCILKIEDTGVRVALRGENAHWKAGDYIHATVEAQPYFPPHVEGMFDTATWLKSQGLAANLYCLRSEYLGRSFSFSALQGWADAQREYLAQVLVPPGCETDKRCQVLCALMLGDKSKSEPDTVNTFKRGGVLHIFAVSGLHVGIIAGILLFTLRYIPMPAYLRTLLFLIGVGAYVLMTGLAVPALRAFLMLALVVIGYGLRRPVSMLNIWAAAALGILLFAPWQMFNAGFVLSFAVYASICASAVYLMKDRPWFAPDSFIPKKLYTKADIAVVKSDIWLRGIIVVSLGAWLVSLPITMGFFHTFNLLSFLTNIVISPLIPLVMALGTAALVLSWVPVVGAWLHGLALHGAGLLINVVSFFSALPGSYMPIEEPSPPDSFMVMHTGYGDCFCVLGNPGVVINCGSEKTARFNVEPALFHGGFKPSALLLTQKRASLSGGSEVLTETWPDLTILRSHFTDAEAQVFSTEAGKYVVVYPPSYLPKSPVQNLIPAVIWECGEQRVMYLGDASVVTYERIPLQYKKVDVVICGRNPAQPVELHELVEDTGASQIILLPNALEILPETTIPAERVELIPISAENPFLLKK